MTSSGLVFKPCFSPKGTWIVTRGTRHPKGYMYIRLPKGIKVKVHRLVCEAFHGSAPSDKPHVNHINGVKDDNRPSNLEWMSQSGNNNHATYQLRSKRGDRKYEFSAIFELIDQGLTHRQVAQELGMKSHSCVSHAVKMRRTGYV